MKVSAKLTNLRISPRKVRLTTEMIKGLDVDDALNQLEAKVKKSNPFISKLVKSAISNAENNFGVDRTNMFVADVMVNAGPTLKRWMPKAYGRAGAIHKRTSAITVIIDERIEGKGRKTKEQLEQEKKKRIEEKRKIEKEAREKEDTKKTEKEFENIEKGPAESKNTSAKGNWGSKIFRRKSM
jgi:large subunit ribosomal protein L22